MSTASDPEDADSSDAAADAPADASGEIVARPGTYYRNARYLMVLLLVGAGAWFAYDGFYGWPEENRKFIELSIKIDDAKRRDNKEEEASYFEQRKSLKFHSENDLRLQRSLAFILPVLGIAFLVWVLRNSRGELRFADNTLHVPGHPPIPVENIREIDKTKWERKGIVYIEYEVPGTENQMARVKLDDFVYQQQPTQAIFKRIESLVVPVDAPSEADSSASDSPASG